MTAKRIALRASLLVTLCAVLVPVLATGSASALTSGYQLYNLTGTTLQLSQLTTDGPTPVFETGPHQGDLLAPGQKIKLEVYRGIVNSENRAVTIRYDAFPTTPDQRAKPRFWKMTLRSNSGTGSCFTPKYSTGSIGECVVRSGSIEMLDPPGTVHNVDADNRQEQAAVLANLCRSDGPAECNFIPNGAEPDKTDADLALASSLLTNCPDNSGEDDDTEFNFKVAHKSSTENSVEAGYSLEYDSNFIFAKAKATIELKYGHKWTNEDEFGTEIKFKVHPRYTGYIMIGAPILRYTGDFHLELGDTTWNLKNVTWDEPDPARHGEAHYYKEQDPATKAELANCAGKKGTLQTSQHALTLTRIGTDGHNVLRGGPESNVLQGLGGNDLLSSGGGNNTLSGGAGNDVLLGNARTGQNVLNGGPGADAILDDGPALVRTGTKTGRGWDYVYVRDGQADDTIVCQSRRTIVYADKGDRVRGQCGRVIRRGPTNRPRPLM